jgi:hypothetical protein
VDSQISRVQKDANKQLSLKGKKANCFKLGPTKLKKSVKSPFQKIRPQGR